MEAPTLRKLLGPGWTYCPRCDQDVMVPEAHGWHCPFCGVGVVVGKPPPIPEMMVWTEPLTGDELIREASHIQAKATAWFEAHKDDKPPRPPRRVVWFDRVVKPIAWLFSCRVVGIVDKKRKEEVK